MKKNDKYNSPCIGVCSISDEYCIGCLRTIEEIESWSVLSNEYKKKILTRVAIHRNNKSNYMKK